jgi:hypothetical protein
VATPTSTSRPWPRRRRRKESIEEASSSTAKIH